MPWRPIDTSEVTQEFSNQEVQSIAGLTQGGSLSNVPNLAVILGNVVNECRGCIIAGGNALDVPGTVPDQMRNTVISIARWRWLSSAPSLNQLKTDDRKSLYTDAIKRLQDVSKGTEKIELPTNPSLSPQAPVNQIETVTHKRRETVHVQVGTGRVIDKMRGLI